MREHLFKGKSLDNGDWVQGWYIEFGKFTAIVVFGRDSEGRVIIKESVEVIPETVCEFTGLTDKDGKKIFEGELLEGFVYPFYREKEKEHNYFAEVIWLDNSAAFGICTHKYANSKVRGTSSGNIELMNNFDCEDWKIIGSKFDNPELLEVD